MTSAISKLFGGGGSKQEPAAVKPVESPVASRTADFAVREQEMGQRAAAAGVMRSENEADMLGYAMPKKRQAGREILG